MTSYKLSDLLSSTNQNASQVSQQTENTLLFFLHPSPFPSHYALCTKCLSLPVHDYNVLIPIRMDLPFELPPPSSHFSPSTCKTHQGMLDVAQDICARHSALCCSYSFSTHTVAQRWTHEI